MKNSCLLLSLLLLTAAVSAQYSMIPASPYKVCQYSGSQSDVTAFNKGNFTYVYWRDNRNGKYEVYGQKLDAAGNPQWTLNGKLMASASVNIIAMRAMAWQNGTFLSYMTSDTCWGGYYNGNGNDVWAQPVVIAAKGNGVIYIDDTGYSVFPNDSGVTITHAVTYTGGSELFTFNRISVAGVLRWTPLQFQISLQGYDYRTVPDQQDGFYVLSKGNGLGSTMFIKRYNFQGNVVWPATVDITSGNSSLGFGGNIYMQTDSISNLYVTWEANGGTIQVTRLDSSGSFVWPSLRTVASGPSAQSPTRPHAKLVGDKIYVTWLESAGSNSICMLQQVDTSGTLLWGTNGVVVDTANGYYGYPKIALSDSNAVAVFFAGIPSVYFQAQRVRSDGSLSWLSNNHYISAVGGDWVAYGDFIPLDDSDNGCNVVFWRTSSSNDIGAAKICSDGFLVSTPEYEGGLSSIRTYPNPAQESIRFEGLDQRMEWLSMYDLQ